MHPHGIRKDARQHSAMLDTRCACASISPGINRARRRARSLCHFHDLRTRARLSRLEILHAFRTSTLVSGFSVRMWRDAARVAAVRKTRRLPRSVFHPAAIPPCLRNSRGNHLVVSRALKRARERERERARERERGRERERERMRERERLVPIVNQLIVLATAPKGKRRYSETCRYCGSE